VSGTAAQRAIEDVIADFDSLPAVDLDAMLGPWSGEIVPTGHRGERALGGLNWAGKDFRSAGDVDPIVVHDGSGGRVASDVMGSAQLRMVEYRGVVTATMIYDNHPVLDHFRQIDPDTVLGLMDRKGEDAPLAFVLRRLRH
jgi:hypothetical protein